MDGIEEPRRNEARSLESDLLGQKTNNRLSDPLSPND